MSLLIGGSIVTLICVGGLTLLLRLLKIWGIPVITETVPSTDNNPIITIPVMPPEPVKTPVQPPVAPTKGIILKKFCTAISAYEGGPGDRNHRNCNPGNTRYSSVGYLAIYQPVKRDKDNFAIFKDWDMGFLYLENLIKEKISEHSDWTIQELMSNYAPKADGNNPVAYAKNVSAAVSLSPSSPAKLLLV